MFEHFCCEGSKGYERFQPQSRKGVRTRQQDGGRNYGTAGEGSRRIHQVFERRSGAGGQAALDQGVAGSGEEAGRVRNLHGAAFGLAQVRLLGLLFTILFFLSACSHKPVTVAVPPAPSPQEKTTQKPPAGTPPAESAGSRLPDASLETIEIPPDVKPLLVETGIASWYGAPYHNRRGSNGEIYDMHAMTAAHRTLPLGSVVRVTDIASGNSAVVRITDRGPFIEGRIVDLSQAAAKKIGLVQKGTAKVRLEVLKTPTPVESGGRWAVQIGAFEGEKAARDLAQHLSRRYQTAKILTFNSPIGNWWVRVRVKDDLRARAEEVMHAAKTNEGAIFLVRLD